MDAKKTGKYISDNRKKARTISKRTLKMLFNIKVGNH